MRKSFALWVIIIYLVCNKLIAQNNLDSTTLIFSEIESLLSDWKNDEAHHKIRYLLNSRNLSPYQNAKLFQSLGRFFNRASVYDSAQYYFDKTLTILEKLASEERNNVQIAVALGQAYYFSGTNFEDKTQNNLAFQHFQEGVKYLLPFQQQKDVAIELAGLYNALFGLHRRVSNFKEAEILAEKAIRYANQANDTLTNMMTNVSVAKFYSVMQRNDEAIDLLKKALVLKPRNPIQEVVIHIDLGNCYLQTTDYAQALLHYQYALKRLEKLQYTGEIIGKLYVNIGIAHFYEAQDLLRFDDVDAKLLDQSNQAYEKAFKIFEETYQEPHQSQAALYSNLGQNYFMLKQYDKARAYYLKSLEIYDKVLIHKDISELATLYRNMGELEFENKNPEKAKEYIKKSLKINQEIFGERHPEVSRMWYMLADLYDKTNRPNEAFFKIQQAITANYENFVDDSPFADIPLYNYLSATDLYNGLLKKATLLNKLADKSNNEDTQKISAQVRKLLYKADSVMLLIRSQNIRQSDKIKNSVLYDRFAAIAVQNTYQLFIQSQNKNYLYDAFYFSERGKAGVLWENLVSSKAKKFALVPDSIIRKEQRLSDNLAFYEQKLSLKISDEEKSIFQSEWQKTQFELSDLIKNVEKQYPQYHQLKYSQSIASVGQIQSRLDKTSALISYMLDAKQSYIFVITQNTFDVVPIQGIDSLNKIVENYYIDLQNGRSLRSYAFNAYQAYNSLIRPIEVFIQEKTNLIIIADDDLLRIPFEPLIQSLPTENQIISNDCSILDYLVQKFDIQYHYTANLWYEYQNLPHKTSYFENDFICFAPFSEQKGGKYQTRSEGYFLPESKEEVNEIYNLFLAQNKTATAYLSTSATKQNFKNSLTLGRIVHIATHSNSERKKLLAKIRFVDCLDMQEDADFSDCLLMQEIYHLNLETDLLVLSSCESGVGKLRKGEGVFSLSRAFLHTGVKNIIFSLWKVQDKNTKNLMIEFYRQLTTQSIPYKTALVNAKRKMIQTNKTLHPREWCGFIIVGR